MLLSKQANAEEDGFSADALPCNEFVWAKVDTGRKLESLALDAFVIVMFNKLTCDYFKWSNTGTYSEHHLPEKKVVWRLELDLADVPWKTFSKVYTPECVSRNINLPG